MKKKEKRKVVKKMKRKQKIILKEKLYIMTIFVMDAKWNPLLEIDINVQFVMTLITVMLVKKNIEININIPSLKFINQAWIL